VPAVPSRADQQARDALGDLIRAKEVAVHRLDTGHSPAAAVSPREPSEQFERIELQHWAMLRLMARKGLITREEFLAEFNQ
jgi:hypothetical protein